MTSMIISHKHKAVAVPDIAAVANLYPTAKTIPIGGAPHRVVPHGPVETILLRKLGFDVPAPILHHYDWCGGKPFDVQRKTCAMLTQNQRAYVLNSMGTGKTKAALWAWDYLYSQGLAGKLLVLAPLSTLTFTWAREVFTTLPRRKCVVLHGDKKRRLERLKDLSADIFIINHDGLKVIEKEVAALGEIGTMVLDELAVYRNGTSQRTKSIRKLAAKMKWVWGMTGSPIPNQPTDVWAQCSVITPGTVPRYFTRFRDEVMEKITMFKWVPKHDAVERAYAVMQPSVRYTLDDILELPECVERTQDVDMGAKQEKIYKQMAEHCHALVAGGAITAANAGAAMSKLLQISTGWVYKSDGTHVALDNAKRIEALIDAINATSNKVLVFVPFKHALAGIGEALKKEGIEFATVSGDTSATQRAEVFNLFQNTGKYHVIAAHPQCLAHGITLTAADTIIWFAPVTSLEIYEQANARIRRVGQKNKQLYLHLQSTAVEKKIYTMLRGKQKVQDKLLDMFEAASE